MRGTLLAQSQGMTLTMSSASEIRLLDRAPPRARVEALLRRSRMLSSLGPEALREAATLAVSRVVPRGTPIWRVGDPATHFQVVVSGIVKLVAPAPGLRPTILDIYGPGETLGYWAAFDGSPLIGDAVPITEQVETLLVPAAVLHHAVHARPAAAIAMTHAVLVYARALRAKIAVLTAGTVPQRLAMLFLDLNTRFGDEAEDGTTLVPVPLSRQDLAQCVGATLETVSRMMSIWRRAGVVDTCAGGFVLRDVDRLTALLEGVPLVRAEELLMPALAS